MLLATDGLANKGVGALEELRDETSAALFYQEVGEQGRLHGVTVRQFSHEYPGVKKEKFSGICRFHHRHRSASGHDQCRY